MPDTTTAFAGTGQHAYICWGLVYANGEAAVGPDYEPHYRTEREATADAPHHAHHTLGVPTPTRLDAACFVAVARCGYVFDEENTTGVHFDSAEDAYRAAVDSGLKDMGDGTLMCSPDCDECTEDAA